MTRESRRRSGDGFGSRHSVQLSWEGFIEMDGTRMTRLLLSARGRERLKWGSSAFEEAFKRDSELAFLPSGRPIDLDCGVRYGIVAEPESLKKP